VPLFVEELTKTVFEGGLLVAGPQGWYLEGPLPPFAMPATLQDSFAARLDRLAPVNEIAQIGAAIGREFSHPLLRAVAGRDEPALRAGLVQLEEAELPFRSGMPPDARYTFKHALVQDTAYETLLGEPAADPAPPDRRCLARRVSGGRGGRTGTRRPSLDQGRARRAGDRMVGGWPLVAFSHSLPCSSGLTRPSNCLG
jgi:hypothetical protein